MARISDDTLAEWFKLVTEDQPKGKPDAIFSRRMAIKLADLCLCEVEPIIKRLESLKLLKAGSWDWFVENGGFTKQHYIDARALPSPPQEGK